MERTAVENTPANGLYLIQFRESPDDKARQQVSSLGIQLLRYVPDDAFIARVSNTPIGQVRALPSILHVEKYRPEHKVHQDLQAQSASQTTKAQQRKPGTEVHDYEVAVLLPPHATGLERARLRRLFSRVDLESRLRSGDILHGRVNGAQLRALAESESVLWIEPFRKMKLFDEVASKIIAGDGGPRKLLSQALGYDGSGVSVAVADSGLNNGDAASMHPDLMGRTPAFFQYGALLDAADEHSHGTHVAGIVAGNGATGEIDENGALYGLGVAPGAEIVAQRIFDAEGNFYPPANGFSQLTSDAVGAGADIGSNSWGDDTQGRYDLSAMAFDELVRDADPNGAAGDQQYILEFSAGNAGPAPQTIGSPAVAKNVIATGAAQNDRLGFLLYEDGIDAMADFSSRGPCEDGRIKPDVVAPGTWIASLQSRSATDQYAWSPISANYQYQGGTSQAGPHVSGLAAVFVQWYRENHGGATPSPALVKAALVNTAVDMFDEFGTAPVPNMDEGWGRVDITPLIDSGLTFDFLDQSVLLTNSQVFERHVVISSTDESLRVTLAYTDVPGFPGAVAALVNDLDLEVISPEGLIYRGNQFDAGESLPNTPVGDKVNNVESVYIYNPRVGEYIVRVRAVKVAQDSRKDTPAFDQDFALVISGLVPPSGVGVVSTDRRAYTAPDAIKLYVYDSDLAGRASTLVRVSSTTEPNGEEVLLQAAGSNGGFAGSISATKGPPAANGSLEVSHNDAIRVSYFDSSNGSNQLATARVDLVPPVLTTPSVTNQFGETLITWSTDEPARAIVRYGLAGALSLGVTNAHLSTQHSIALEDLVPLQTYSYQVICQDEAGNRASNQVATLIAPKPNTLLLVDAYGASAFDNEIPLSVYTDPLDQLGLTYDVWKVADMGHSPGTNDLRPYRMIIWRLNDGIGSSDTLSANEQNSIRSYLRQGGAFFMASMEQLTRLGAGAFRREVLHVSDFHEDSGVGSINGFDADPITRGMSMTLDYSQYANFLRELMGVPDDISDTMLLLPDASPIFVVPFGDVAGMRYPRTGQDGVGRVVFLSFPLDAIPESGTVPNDRLSFMKNVVSFLVPGVGGTGTIALDSSSYTLPSSVTIEVGDSDLAGQTNAAVTVFSTTEPWGLPLLLQETAVPGLFRGQVDVIADSNPQTSGKLRAKHSDSLWVDYRDASANSTVRASATIDTAPPLITEVAATPEYEQAIITWTSSEDADSTVQFGESLLLNRTAYDGAYVGSHEVVLPGLVPDKVYYYQVVSRDAAGNFAVDDNGGKLHTVRTLAPIRPPWSDDMNNSGTNWDVYVGDGSQTSWQLGVPANSLATAAHSPPDAWGSNLDGGVVDMNELFLISPAIHLTGGNTATLRFWHNYEFQTASEFDILEYGAVLVITNNTAAPITLAEYSDWTSAGWEMEEIDLTKYLGQVVYLVWNYELFSFDSYARPGWLVDDVSVTVSNAPLGTLIISNNISQAASYLTGPLSRTNQGSLIILSNAPAGQYTLVFGDVPYYTKPGPQTRNLESGATQVFTGNYSFADANTNGISDAWEQAQFGIISPDRNSLTDTDGDGATDHSEFIAGTDPKDPLSRLALSGTSRSANSVTLSWFAAPGRSYRVESSVNLIDWNPTSGWLLNTGGPQTMSFQVPASSAPETMYRVQVLP